MVRYAPLNDHVTLTDLWAVRGFRLNVIGAVMLTLIASPLVYMIFDTIPPYYYFAEESFIKPPAAKGGDQVLVMWKVKRNRICPGTSQRFLFDPTTKVILASYDPSPAALFPEKAEYLNRTFLLPKQIQSGWIGYRAVLKYHCNPLQHVWPLEVTTPDLFFKIEE